MIDDITATTYPNEKNLNSAARRGVLHEKQTSSQGKRKPDERTRIEN